MTSASTKPENAKQSVKAVIKETAKTTLPKIGNILLDAAFDIVKGIIKDHIKKCFSLRSSAVLDNGEECQL